MSHSDDKQPASDATNEASPEAAAEPTDDGSSSVKMTISRRGLVAGVVALPVLMHEGAAAAQQKVKLNPESLTGVKAVKTRTTLFTTLDKISKDEKLIAQFSTKPVDALTVAGWSTDKNFPKVDARAIQSFTNRVGAHNPAALTVCGSVGCIVCASVGGDT